MKKDNFVGLSHPDVICARLAADDNAAEARQTSAAFRILSSTTRAVTAELRSLNVADLLSPQWKEIQDVSHGDSVTIYVKISHPIFLVASDVLSRQSIIYPLSGNLAIG